MFEVTTFIDAIQNSKKQFVNTFITDKKFQAELIKLIDAQSAAAKASADTSIAIIDAFVKNAKLSFAK